MAGPQAPHKTEGLPRRLGAKTDVYGARWFVDVALRYTREGSPRGLNDGLVIAIGIAHKIFVVACFIFYQISLGIIFYILRKIIQNTRFQ